MRTKIKAYFHLNRKDLRGICMLFVLVLILLLAPGYYRSFHPPKVHGDEKLKKILAEYVASLPREDELPHEWANSKPRASNYAVPEKTWNPEDKIDPNNTSTEELIAAGISPKTAKRWFNYSKAGGRFFGKKDLHKIYGISKKDIELAEALVHNFPSKKKWTNEFDSSKNSKQEKSSERKFIQKKDSLFAFDPNRISEEALSDLPFSAKARKSLLAYRKAGGKFKIKSDLKKLYGLNAQDYQTVESFIDLPEEIEKRDQEKSAFYSENSSNNSFEDYEKSEVENQLPEIKIDINKAAVNDWMEVKGIGKYYARAITKYRTELGGFHSIEQIEEVPGMRKESYLKVKPYLKMESLILKKIDVNSVEKEQLAAHPYIESKVASSIVKYRRKHGPYEELKDLKKSYLIDEKLLTKISPYLSIGSINDNHDSSENTGTPELFKGSRTGP